MKGESPMGQRISLAELVFISIVVVAFGVTILASGALSGPEDLPRADPPEWAIKQMEQREAEKKDRAKRLERMNALIADAEEVAPNIYRRWDGEYWIYWNADGKFTITAKHNAPKQK